MKKFPLKDLHKDRKKRYILLAAAVVAVAVIMGSAFFHPVRKATKEVDTGLNYLTQMAGKSSADIESNIKNMQQERDRQRRIEAREKALAEGTVTVWELFDDYVFLGDSRVVGFSEFGFLESGRIIAHSGDGVKNIADSLDTVRYYNPSLVFISYGANDLGNYASAEAYADALNEQIQGLKDAAPHAAFIVSSIMPVYSSRLSSISSNYDHVDTFNEALAQMCSENGYTFVDNTQLAEEHRSEYEQDGIHFKSSFYEDWALNLINGVDAN